jgi:hypothetical protein
MTIPIWLQAGFWGGVAGSVTEAFSAKIEERRK